MRMIKTTIKSVQSVRTQRSHQWSISCHPPYLQPPRFKLQERKSWPRGTKFRIFPIPISIPPQILILNLPLSLVMMSRTILFRIHRPSLMIPLRIIFPRGLNSSGTSQTGIARSFWANKMRFGKKRMGLVLKQNHWLMGPVTAPWFQLFKKVLKNKKVKKLQSWPNRKSLQ